MAMPGPDTTTLLRRSTVLLYCLLGMLLVFTSLSRAATSEDARNFVQGIGDSAIRDLTASDISDADRVDRMRALLAEAFDVPEVGRSVLGPFYRQTSPESFAEFLDLYEIYVAHNYAALFKKYRGETIEVVRTTPMDEGEFRVDALIHQISGPPIALEMQVHEVNSALKAIDLRIEGISMPLTHRRQFVSVITRSGDGVDGLNAALRNAVARFEAQLSRP